MREFVAACLGCALAIGLTASAETETAIVLPAPLASLDIANSSEGAYPGGSTSIRGKWFVEKSAKKLKLAVEPLEIGWLEFGPEIRERGATIRVLARAPGEGRLRSRMGAGLYGKNGFQVRVDQGKRVVELVRRGIVLQSVEFSTDPEALSEIELSVIENDEDWDVSARVWVYESDRPHEPLLQHRAYGDELLFPLAGRPCLVATPFSGESVQYAMARVFDGDPYAPVEEVEGEVPE